MKKKLKDSAEFFKKKKIGIIPTDTLYGVSASIFFPEIIEKVYKITKRDLMKPFIILIGSIKDLNLLDIKLSEEKKKELEKIWPEKISIILPCFSEKMAFLHRGKKTLAVRFPKKESLKKLLQKTGPLISTSANPESKIPAQDIKEAKKYFGDKIDFYVDEGKLPGIHSTLLDMTGEKMKIIRKGEWKNS